MKLNYKKIGDYIKLVDERNKNFEVTNLLGINIRKKFMPSVANTSKTDLSKYKIIRKGQFAYSAMQVGRDETVRVVLYSDDNPAIISPAYLIFEVEDINKVLPEYLMMYFQRPESDRYGWFISDGSVRSSLEWERFCEIEIPIPEEIETQRNVVAVYNEFLRNQKCFEGSLEDLQLICDTFIENLLKKNELKTLGEYIQQSEYENYGLPLSKVRGVSIHKVLIKPKANMTNVKLSGYKLLKKGQFVFNPNTARMGERIPIALNTEEDYIVSKIYPVFEITKEDLLPEFLYLWFTRQDFDRYARFHSWGSARETFNWEDMCAVRLPIPDIEVQNSIVDIHHVLESRKKINEDLKNMIAPLCPVLIKGVVDNFKVNKI
ncbi:MAG: restriction endonuclease subunit S [Candidatus Dojkabacteria bacterium]|jgi:type I restriction enzyme S subunit|nr:restriction endonuclease subunit S [Candidatus Dojkabacteria bacterium]